MGNPKTAAEFAAGAVVSGGAEEIRAHMEKVLESPPFRSSNRSRQFLEYVVTSTLDGQSDRLKERSIGEQVFGRSADYDTGQDSIVRVKANEVRRRLAQYYDLHPDAPLRIDLPSGSYAPQFRPASVVASPLAVEKPLQWRPWLAAIVLSSVTLAAALAWTLWPARVRGSFDRFWEPFLSNARELMICLPTPETYRIYGTDRDALVKALKPQPPGVPPPLLPQNVLDDVRIIPEPGLLVGLGDARALTLVHSLAVSRAKVPQIRMGNLTTFAELRSGPSILIGGVTNRWAQDLTSGYRFGLSLRNGRYVVHDSLADKILCEKPASWEPRSTEDCAVLTRVLDSKTGQPLLIAAGLHHFGTFAVGEFLTRPELLEAALQTAPTDWETKNLQVVIRVETVRDNIAPPEILAVHAW